LVAVGNKDTSFFACPPKKGCTNEPKKPIAPKCHKNCKACLKNKLPDIDG